MALTVQFNPQPFGQVLSVTPGTPVQLAKNLPGFTPVVALANGSGVVTDSIPSNKLSVIASPLTHSGAGNTGNVYIGMSNLNRTTLAGVVAVLTPGSSIPVTNNVSLNIYQFEKWYMDADNAGDGVYGSFDVV